MFALSRRFGGVLVLLLALLLAGMQQESLRHALTHLGSIGPTQQLANPQADTPCAECALLAGGAAALACDPPSFAALPADHVAIPAASIAPRPARPAFYRSRAPPALS
jgi:hypothetical protein